VRALAERAGVSTRTVTQAEHGRRVPNLTTMRKLCDALDVDPLAREIDS
jgi:transcriptional regulator with XRE-family HTH domain